MATQWEPELPLITGDPYTPVRWWLYDKLNTLLPSNKSVISSKLNPVLFQEWTGTTHDWLVAQWNKEAMIRLHGDHAGTTTSCNAFLGVVVAKTRIAGKLPVKAFNSFDLPVAGGAAWHWYAEGGPLPQSGDFFQLGTRGGMYEHVGVVLDFVGTSWTTIEAGDGGPRRGYDTIHRKGPRPCERKNLMGWIDAEEFFAGWQEPAVMWK